jgi:abortive infection bacteriophage resistance protein
MAYSKPWRSVADQLAQLQARDMQIGDKAGAGNVLESRRGASASYQKS